MNQYRTDSAMWRTNSSGASGWSSVTDFAQRQPILVMAGAFIGGALLALFVKNATRSSTGVGYNKNAYHTNQQRWDYPKEAPYHTPSAHMGATEDQMEAVTNPSRRAMEAGATGATGAAYELDPDSITAG